MFKRSLSKKIAAVSRQFPVVAITGPRQSGKTTLVQTLFEKKPYANLEQPDLREYALKDPKGFLAEYPEGAILDEVQRVPQLFSYIQVLVDQKQKPAMYVLTGSQQFGMMEKISQSLAGRVAILHLLPLSLEELKGSPQEPKSIEEVLFKGLYPKIYHPHIDPGDWFSNYLQTYVERDVRLLKNIEDLSSFQQFLKMCAARTGQLLNLSSLGNDCGITHNTAKSWLSILEASFLVFLLRPHHKNFNKRLIKAPKIYFWDTGLACHLLGIDQFSNLSVHAKRGEIFETWVVAEFMKQFYNSGKRAPLYFWQDKRHEVDLLFEKGGGLIPIEIKAGKTVNTDYFSNLAYWCGLAKKETREAFLIYAGMERQKREAGKVFGWKSLPKLAED